MGRVFILGIDGATWAVIRPMMDDGRLPNLKRIVDSGVCGKLESTVPPLSAPAWISFMTGKNPGKHGVLDFFEYDLSAYGPRPGKLVDSTRFAGTTIWDIMSAHGKKVGVVTVPVTFPAWPINGVMVSGHLMTPETATGYTYPEDLEKWIGESPNVTELYKQSTPLDEVKWRGPEMMERRTRIALDLLARDSYDCFALVLAATDKAQHDFWRFQVEDDDLSTPEERRRLGDGVAVHYEKADWALGEILARVGDNDTIIVMSDHGAGLYPPRSFNTNLWLARLGLLKKMPGGQRWSNMVQRSVLLLKHLLPARWYAMLKERTQRTMPGSVSQALHEGYVNIGSIDWSRTKAYRFPLFPFVEGIIMNVKGRQVQGTVAPGEEYDKLRLFIVEQLQQLVDPADGSRLVERAYLREELYHGDYVQRMPDIIVVLNPRYRGDKALTGEVITPTPLYDRRRFGGTHRMQGIFLAQGPGLKKGETLGLAHLLDLAPTILHIMGLEVPSEMDGELLKEAFLPEYLDSRVVRYTDSSAEVRPNQFRYSEGEEQEILDRLEGLGYL
jgi:predicted AlkP superfamily phosphohydrolase/phosphomutase